MWFLVIIIIDALGSTNQHYLCYVNLKIIQKNELLEFGSLSLYNELIECWSCYCRMLFLFMITSRQNKKYKREDLYVHDLLEESHEREREREMSLWPSELWSHHPLSWWFYYAKISLWLGSGHVHTFISSETA